MFGFLKKAFSIFNRTGTERKANAADLEESLIQADLGGTLSSEISKTIIKMAGDEKTADEGRMREILVSVLSGYVSEFKIDDSFVNPQLFLVLGVNGSGKTTTCAKIAHYYKNRKKKVLLAAADTFRAAAQEQLSLHAQRIGVRIIRKDNAGNPAAVIYDALDSFMAQKEDLLVADTAGRMHTRSDLIREIQKIDRIVNGKIEKDCYRKFLVLDATTGQNAIAQAENFDKALGIDALILTKVDSGSRGGTLLRISHSLGIPVAFLCSGEKYDDIRPFNKADYIESLLD